MIFGDFIMHDRSNGNGTNGHHPRMPSFAETMKLARSQKHEPTPQIIAEQAGDHVILLQESRTVRLTQDWAKMNKQRFLNFCETGEWK